MWMSNLPGLRRAESMALGLLVAAKTKTPAFAPVLSVIRKWRPSRA